MYSLHKLKSLFLGLVFLVVTVNFICINEQETCRAIFDTFKKLFSRRPLAKLLIIGVASAPGHFQRREAARATWMSLLNDEIVDVKFIVGRHLCGIPPDDRITPWDCIGWNLTTADFTKPLSTFRKSRASSNRISSFTFIVKRSIHLMKLGVAACALNGSKARLILLDASNNKKIASATFLKESGDIHWKGVNVSLSEGFEGELMLKSDSLPQVDCPYVFNSEGVIHFFETSNESGSYKRAAGDDGDSVAFGFTYLIDDPQNVKEFLRDRTERFKDWALKNERLKTELSLEANHHKDILFVETVDVYKHVTLKIGLFYEWLNEFDGYEFVLKTDDDVFLDVTRIVAQLEASRAERVTQWWWSCFKVNSTARPAGKWRDRISKLRVYPPFPCGAGYVLSSDLIDELFSSISSSHVGEDVALGLWAETRQLSTPRRPICYWSCGRRCDIINHPRCNLVELDSEELLFRTWEMYQDCGNFICDCL